MMQEENRIYRSDTVVYQRRRREKDIHLYANAPFGAHVGACLQSDGALAGH
jgi:hypothetical protein